MATYITVDSGTTNTRVSLVVDGAIVDSLKFGVEASSASERRQKLAELLKVGIQKILKNNNKTEKEIERVIASGMITSEIGLVALEHIKAPCGIPELSQNLYETVFAEITNIPFVFVRGVKYISAERVDMMRGEEAEIYGINEKPESNSLYVLPGSHSKLIYIDDIGRISTFSTELTGELIGAVAKNTILSNIIDLNQTATDSEYLQKGYTHCIKHGMNAALFSVRSLKLSLNCSDSEIFSYFMGVLLAPEIKNIVESSADKVIIGGKNQLKDPTSILVRLNSTKTVETVPEEIADTATAYGCIRIYENSLKL